MHTKANRPITLLAAAGMLAFSPLVGAAEPNSRSDDKPPAPLDIISMRPADRSLKRAFDLNFDGDGIGGEMPSAINYSASSKASWIWMTVTDRRLCKRKDEKAICKAFEKLIDGPTPKLGTDVTETRISGSDYRTAYLKPTAGIEYPGVDKFVAFLGADSQDPPLSYLRVYLYAKQGTSLIQLSARVAECNPLPKEGESDEAYYRKHCVGEQTMRKAGEKAKAAAESFRLQP